MSYQIYFQREGFRFFCREGITIYEAAGDAGIFFASDCGGRMACGRCLVRVLDGKVSPLSDIEREVLAPEQISAGFRLACAARVLSDLKLHIPQVSILPAHRHILSGMEPPLSIDSGISIHEISLEEPGNKNPLADWENICKGLKDQHGLTGLRPDMQMLHELPPVLRETGQAVAVTVKKDEVIGVHSRRYKMLGVALDIGTTKIAAYIVNPLTGETLAAGGTVNPQVTYGGDVMSRLKYAIGGHGEELREVVVTAINRLIEDICDDTGKIMEVAIAGNTAMHHLFLGLPVEQLCREPFLPVVCDSLEIKASNLGLKTAAGAYASILPNIAGFTGGDHVAMLLASGLYEANEIMLGIDIGTNTEIALANEGIITTLSCASGPAFEGNNISHGMVADRGAIERVRLEDNIAQIEVIDNTLPVGVCGPGILDAISEMHRYGIIDQLGRLRDHALVRMGAAEHEFLLVSAKETGTGEDIVISQRDIGEIQLAKAAIRTGITILLKEAGIGEDDIKEVIIAGGFGSRIDAESVINIGMLPSLPAERFIQVGNAAGIGARLALLSGKKRAMADSISRDAGYIELTLHPEFTNEFSRAVRFP